MNKSIFAVRELVLLFPETNECLDVKGAGEHM